MRTIIEIGRAVNWVLRGRHSDLVAHAYLEHAHWDRATRLWVGHEAPSGANDLAAA
jgi:hypothetical protein